MYGRNFYIKYCYLVVSPWLTQELTHVEKESFKLKSPTILKGILQITTGDSI